MSYWRFAAMIATSTVVMFGLMYLNTYALDHVSWSETRAWMALLMGASMAIIMLGYMLSMYKNRMLNIGIFVGAALAFAVSLWLVRSQVTIDDAEYMKAMVPHHSIAIMTSNRAQISDPRVRKLADEIIEAQELEIAEMKYLVRDLAARAGRDRPDDALEEVKPPQVARITPAAEMLEGAHIRTLDPEHMDDAEIRLALGDGTHCLFRYSSAGKPVLAVAEGSEAGQVGGVVKLNGQLVLLTGSVTEEGALLDADRLWMSVRPDGGFESVTSRQETDVVLQVGEELTAGYRGYLSCPRPDVSPAP
jgi:hypothetical protein